jgi:hypothetical protein
MIIVPLAREAAAAALRDAASVIARANADFVNDYAIKGLAKEFIGEDVPHGVVEFLNRRADEIQAGGPLEVVTHEGLVPAGASVVVAAGQAGPSRMPVVRRPQLRDA